MDEVNWYFQMFIQNISETRKIRKMKDQKRIQTLHPIAGKKNKKILLNKYEVIRENLLAILTYMEEPTHTELMEELYSRVKDNFEGGVQWYGETVKLDLEAREIIERTGKRPERYRLKRVTNN